MKNTPKRPAKKGNRRETIGDSIGTGKQEVSPEVKELMAEQSATLARPTSCELAQLAALMADPKSTKKGAPNRAEQALLLWKQCRDVLWDAIRAEIDYVEMREAVGELDPPEMKEWEHMLMTERFPTDFERALAVIVGGKTRRGDRYRLFRAFMRDVLRTKLSDETLVEGEVERRFVKLKAEGYEAKPFRQANIMFERWRKARLQEKARNAASKRWAKAAARKGA